MRHGILAVSIALVAIACQSDDGDDAVEGTPIEEPSTVTEANDEPEPETTPPRSSTETLAPTAPTTDVFVTVPPEKTTPAVTAPPGEPATETVYEVGMIDPGLAPFVTMATDDLAERLGVAPESIELLTAVLVTWPNAALGCPEPDRSYAQVLTDGSVIELGADGLVYRYHTGGSRTTPFACDRPLDPVPAPVG